MILKDFAVFLCTWMLGTQCPLLKTVKVKSLDAVYIGKSVETRAENIFAENFLGIPYAEPPVGDLRFDYPKPKEVQGEFSALNYGAKCPAGTFKTKYFISYLTNEDCLTLNVQRPVGTTSESNLPVVAVIHGGGFSLGSSQDFYYDVAELAARHNIIAVSMNYRLGVLGFADMKELAPGNLGLHDQVLALEWIQKHIADFGGNPKEVTLMGVSAGSFAISGLIISPMVKDKGLFNKAIMDAGAFTNAFVDTPEESLQMIQDIAEDMKCPTSGSEMLACLRKADPYEMVGLSLERSTDHLLTFLPTRDGKFLPQDLNNGITELPKSIPVMLGVATNEGSLFVGGFLAALGLQSRETRLTQEDFIEKLKVYAHDWKIYVDVNDPAVLKEILRVYRDSIQGEDKTQGLIDILSYGTFICPKYHFLNNYQNLFSNIYMYHFNRTIQNMKWFDVKESAGVFHSSPYLHLSGGLRSMIYPDGVDDRFMRESMLMTAEFIKTGNQPIFRDVQWPDFKKENKVMILDEEPQAIDKPDLHDRCKIFGGM